MNMLQMRVMAVAALCFLHACGDEADPGPDPSDDNQAALSTLRSGALVEQDEPGTRGTVSIARDEAGTRFIVLADDFNSNFATGSVALFLAKSSANLTTQAAQDAGNVSPRLAVLAKRGAQRFELPTGFDADGFSYAIVFCESVAINFAAARLE